MSDKPKRKFWQIHLSTAALSMFFVAGMIYANFQDSPELYGKVRDVIDKKLPLSSMRPLPPPEIFYRVRGWPFKSSTVRVDTPATIPAYRWLDSDYWQAGSLLNIPICILLTLAFAFVYEYLIRRSEGRTR